MTTERVDPVVRVRGRTPGPEAVGGIAAVIVVAIVAFGVMSPFASGSGDVASPTPAPSVTASPTARATPVIDPAVADLLIVVNQQLTRSGERLQQELDHDPFRTADVSTLIRELNASARFGGEALPALGSVPEAAALAGRLGAVYDSLREIATRTLRASITNAPAYRQGAEQLVAQLADLPALQDELVRLKSGPSESPAGSSPGPSAASPGPSSSASPSSLPPSSAPSPAPTVAPTLAPTWIAALRAVPGRQRRVRGRGGRALVVARGAGSAGDDPGGRRDLRCRRGCRAGGDHGGDPGLRRDRAGPARDPAGGRRPLRDPGRPARGGTP